MPILAISHWLRKDFVVSYWSMFQADTSLILVIAFVESIQRKLLILLNNERYALVLSEGDNHTNQIEKA